jgi:hypothetical protein
MGTHHRDAGPRAGSAHDIPHVLRRHVERRSTGPHEHRTTRRHRSSTAKVDDQRLADIDGHRQALDARSLAADHDLAGRPVQVIEAKADDLTDS